MTVKELQEILSEYPDDWEVMIKCDKDNLRYIIWDRYDDIDEVDQLKNEPIVALRTSYNWERKSGQEFGVLKFN
jgi:hypothetical protein